METSLRKCNLRIKQSDFDQLKSRAMELGIGHEQLLRIMIEACLPVYTAQTPTDLKEALTGMAVLSKVRAF
ncbi:hypothetical protein ACJJIG_16105 [Microbulbifer sp. SSSA007]|uniref:hypothetical protein n=1 Tax=Microbulbifer sp. SSSA007 TaxID=3243379 RepID=UPI00403A2D08